MIFTEEELDIVLEALKTYRDQKEEFENDDIQILIDKVIEYMVSD